MATYLVTVTVLLITVGGSNALLDSPLNPLLQPTGPYYPPLNLFSTDPELTMTTPQIIQRWGYTVENYTVETSDGYILTIFRIPYGKNGPTNTPRPAVFFQHGLLCSSSDWVVNLPNESAAFLFADAGFDVWLGNMRGNTYSKAHKTLSTSDHAFWEFTWDDMMRHDLDAMIDKVRSVTGQPKIIYVGHSQGTLTMFVKLSIDQIFADKISAFFALAPVCKVHHIKGLLQATGDLNVVETLLYAILGQNEFLPNDAFMRLAAQYGCSALTQYNKFCGEVMFLVGGPDTHQFNQSRIPVFISQTPAGTSSANFIHLGRMVTSDTLMGFDWYNTQKNIQHYGTAQVPCYNISTVNVPTYMFTGDKDWLSNPQDMVYIRTTLNQNIIKLDEQLSDFNHFDFIWGLNATDLIYNRIINIINQEILTG